MSLFVQLDRSRDVVFLEEDTILNARRFENIELMVA